MQTWWTRVLIRFSIFTLAEPALPAKTSRWMPCGCIGRPAGLDLPAGVGRSQAPCTTFKNKMSANPDQAYQQGRAEADFAADAATRLGFFGNMVIYNDIEAYASADSSCRQAVQSFVRGWVERLDAHGLKAGWLRWGLQLIRLGLGQHQSASRRRLACSLVSPQLRPGATVWDTPCAQQLGVSHQRVKQYAGGHNESWGRGLPSTSTATSWTARLPLCWGHLLPA